MPWATSRSKTIATEGISYNRRMVVRSGDESIVRYNRGFTLTLHVAGWALILLAAADLGGAFLGKVNWSSSLFFWVASVYVVWRVFSIARPFSRCFVAIGPEGVRLGLMKRTGSKRSPLPEQRLKWEEIGGLTYDSDKGVCRFRARNSTYELTDDNSPSPRTVAKLMAERMGVELPVQELLVPPGKRPVPRLTQAAIMGGISILLLGAAVAGALWMRRQADGPFTDVEGVALIVLGLLGMVLFLSAIVLVIVEVTHRV
jgi:hypothetical protein